MVHFLPIDTEFGCSNTDLFYDPLKIANGLSTRDHWPFCSEILKIFLQYKNFLGGFWNNNFDLESNKGLSEVHALFMALQNQ